MSGYIGRRIDRLAGIYQARGCPMCEPWQHTSVVIIDPSADSPTIDPVDLASPPPRCPDCGRRTPAITQTVIIALDRDHNPEVAS